jgi:hypothetical protein
MLDDVEKSADRDIVSWGPRGLTFIVRSKPLFAATIAPKYFKILSHSNFRMVLQQTWGFVVDSDVQSGYEIYHHPKFVRDDPVKCDQFTAQQKKDPSLSVEVGGQGSSASFNLQEALLLLQSSRDMLAPVATSVSPPTVPAEALFTKRDQHKFGIGQFLSNSRRSSTVEDGTKVLDNGRHSGFLPQSPTVELLQSVHQRRNIAPSVSLSHIKREDITDEKLGEKHKEKTGLSMSYSHNRGSICKSKALHRRPTDRNFTGDIREILSAAEAMGFDHIVSWMPHGRSFKVHKDKEFVKVVLPKFTNKTAFASFRGGLYRYGFKRIDRGTEAGAYFHPLFIRQLPILCHGKNSLQMKAAGWKQESTPDFFLAVEKKKEVVT